MREGKRTGGGGQGIYITEGEESGTERLLWTGNPRTKRDGLTGPSWAHEDILGLSRAYCDLFNCSSHLVTRSA